MWSDKGTRHALTADVLGKMFYLDEQNRLQLSLAGSLYVGPDGKIRIRTGDTLSEGPGSPIELNANPRASQFTTVTQEVVDESVSTITIDLQTLRTLLTAPLAGMVFGRGSASAGSGEWLTLGAGLSIVGTTISAASGSGNAVYATVDFGASFTHYATVAVTGQTWVTALSKIVAMPTGGNPMENAILQFAPTVTDLVVGDGFTLSVYTPVKAKGTYTFNCIGV